MALIEVNTTWTSVGNGNGGATATGSGTAFDTATKQLGSFSATRALAVGESAPLGVHLAAGAYLTFECGPDFTQTKWFYDGAGAVYTTTTPNSTECGWSPPVEPLTCDLGVATVSQTGTPTGTTLTASTSGPAHGSLRYRLDAGVEQAGATFTAVAPGAHVVRIRDTALAGCERTVTVAVAAPPALAVPLGGPVGLDFVGQPLWYVPAGVPAGAEVYLELYAESAHGQEDFARVLTLRKWADAAGQVAFRLDTLLAPLLRAYALPVPAGTARCRSNLLNYFVRTSAYAPGHPGTYATGPLRTALRGGLPAEWRGVDYWAWRLDAFGQPPFLSWQPTGPAKRITAAQPEWLFWLAGAEALDQVRVRREYTGTGLPTVTYEPVSLADPRGSAGQLLAVPVLPGAVAGARQVSVSVVSSDGTALSPLARFELVAAQPQTRYLVFSNSLGGLDTLRCEGELTATLEAKAEAAERPAAFGDAPGVAERHVLDLSATRKRKLATGWLTAAELDWLQELVFARELWLAHPRLGLLPLELSKRSVAHYSDAGGLRGLVLEYDDAFAPTAYANF